MGRQVSFPGGRMDAEDCSIAATALRECEEEIGLSPASVLGLYHDVPNKHSETPPSPGAILVPPRSPARINTHHHAPLLPEQEHIILFASPLSHHMSL